MKQFNLLYIFPLFAAFLFFSNTSQGQVRLYSQNFDSVYALPTGWWASDSSWAIDSTNSSTGYIGASGLNNVSIQNVSARLGNDTVMSNGISTLGYNTITAIWGARNTTHFSDSGSAITGFYWINEATGSWNKLTYTENANNSTWSIDNAGAPISLPDSASNLAAIKFVWIANIKTTPSGTYRIDDFNVAGVSTAGINDLSESKVLVYVSNAYTINIAALSPLDEKLDVKVYTTTGELVRETTMTNQLITLDASNFSTGIYFVQVGNQWQNTVSKVFIK